MVFSAFTPQHVIQSEAKDLRDMKQGGFRNGLVGWSDGQLSHQ